MVMQEILNSRREFDPQDMRVVLGPELAAFAAEPSSTGWVYDQASSRYRNLHDGTFMSQAQMIQLRNDFAGSRGVAVQLLAQNLLSGSISLGEWQAAMAAEIKLDIAVEYAFGVGGIMMMNENDWTAVDAMNTLQNQFLDRFAQALKDGTVTEAQLFQRASMYVDSGIQAFERGQAAANDLDLPVYPGEDCDGLTNCRCFWSFDEQDDGSVDCTWNAVGDKNTCDPCQQHANDYDPITLGGPDDAGFSIPAATEDQPAVIMRTDPEAHARTILERNAGVAPTALFGWVTINGEHILISDVKTGRYSVGITSDEFHAAKIGDKAQSFELQSALSHLKATDVELSIGRGGWKSDEGKLFEENALALSFKDGSPEAVSREMAALGGKWGQLSALVQHYVRSGGEPQAQIDMGRRLSDAEVTDVADGLKEHFGGWTFAVDPASGSTKLVVSNVKAWGGPPDAEFKNQVHAVADSLKQGGLDTSVAWHQVENIPLDHLSSAKLSADGQVGRRDQGSSGEPERSEVPGARAEETGRAGTGGGSVPRGVPARLEEGILAKLSDAEKLRLTLEESPPAVAFGWVTIDGHPVLIGSPEEVASATATINQLRDPSTGHVVGAPAGAQTVQGLLELRAHLNTLATAGESQKDWYINSSKAILEAAQGNKADAEKLAQLVAIYSPKTSPSVDMNDALDAWYQWKAGVPIKVGIGARDQIASDLLYKNQSWDGRKTNNFYRNLMVGVDSEAANKMGAEVGQSGVTADIWMARAFNYTATEGAVTQDNVARSTIIAPSGRQYDFIASEVGLVAKQKGWTPEQTQAAIWSATKAKSEGTNLDASGYDFSDALAERAGLVTPAVASAFQDGQGRDTLARAFGLVGGDNTFALPKAPQSSAGHDIPKNLGRVQEDARDSITAYTAARALLLKQPTATWTRMFPSLTIKAANATVLDAGRPLTASETSTLNQALGSALGRTNAHTTIPTDTGAWILNTTQPPGKAPRANAIDNAAFQKSVTSAVSSLSMDTTHVPGRYDGQSFTNDWTKNPDGKTYLTAIQRSGQADNFGAVASDLAARVAAAQGTAVGVGAAFGWVTIGGNPVLIGEDGPAKGGAGRPPLTKANLAAQKKLQSAKRMDTEAQGKLLEAAVGVQANLGKLDPKETLPGVKAIGQLIQDYPISTLAEIRSYSAGGDDGWTRMATAQYRQDVQGGVIGLNSSMWDKGNEFPPSESVAADSGNSGAWWPNVALKEPAAYIPVHEFGHAVMADIVARDPHALDEFHSAYPATPISGYAGSMGRATPDHNPERDAEAFAGYYYGSDHPDATAMGKVLTKVYGDAPRSTAKYPAKFDAGFGWVTIGGNHVLIGDDTSSGGGRTKSTELDGNLRADNPSEYVSKGFDTNPGQHQTPVAANRLLLARLASDQIGPEAVQPALSWSAESARNADNVASEVAAKAVFGGGKTSYLPAGAQPDPSRMAVLTSTYAVTQRALAEARIGDMSIYRGTSYTATNVPPEFAAIPPGKSATLSINTAPLSSFSLHEDQALKYTALFGGQGGGRYVISTTIPRKAIFATPQQGWGNPASHEVMVLGAERNYVVTHIAESPTPAAHSAGFKAEVVSLDDEPDNADWIRIINGVIPRAKFSGGPYEFGSTQINLPADLAAKVIAFQKTIDPADLGAGGLEDQPHITLLYGLDPSVTPDDVGRVVGSRDLVDVTFGKTSTFPAGNDGAPLFVTVTSPGLGRLHDALAKALPNKQTHAGYKPHVTIAYLTAAAAEKYADQPGPLNGKSATFDVIVHSSTDRTQTEITLGTENESADFADGHWVTIDGNPVMIGHSSAVMTAARTIRSSAQERAATVTPMLQQLAAKQGSKLSGLQFAIKGEGSLADKIDSRSRLLGIAPSEVPIGDALRYTLVSPPAQLASNATETIAKLQSSGFTVNTDNYWVRGDTFNGIASDVKAPDGQRFELQFHTDESVATKERTHADYEILRDIDKTTAERFAAFQRMVPIADAMALPPNVMSVGTPTLAPFKP